MVDISSFSEVGRNPEHCFAIWKTRIKHNMPVLNEKNRLKFMLLTVAELHPDTPLGRWVKDMMYEDRECFEKMNLTSLGTIERDNRELERKGWFMKEKPQSQQATL